MTGPENGRIIYRENPWNFRIMISPLAKRSVTVRGRKTSVTLEKSFWDALSSIAEAEEIAVSALISEIDQERSHGNLSAAVRSFVLTECQERAAIAEAVEAVSICSRPSGGAMPD
jgi:predicted DNA-binding ribbon-helix-helix protein